MLDIRINWEKLRKNSPAPLHKMIYGLVGDRECPVYLTLSGDIVDVEIDDSIGGGIPFDVYHSLRLRFEIPNDISYRSLKKFIKDNAKYLEEIKKGTLYGRNKKGEYVGILDEQAMGARQSLRGAIDTYEWDYDIVATIWDYYKGHFERKGEGYLIKGFNLWIFYYTTNRELEAISDRLVKSAKKHGVKIEDPGAMGILSELRDELEPDNEERGE